MKFTLYNFTEDLLEEAANDMNITSLTPVLENLFEVDNDSTQLTPKRVDYFYQMTARLLFATKRAKLNIQVTVAFLFTMVKEPTEDNYTKPTWVIKYLRKTVHLPLIIG